MELAGINKGTKWRRGGKKWDGMALVSGQDRGAEKRAMGRQAG